MKTDSTDSITEFLRRRDERLYTGKVAVIAVTILFGSLVFPSLYVGGLLLLFYVLARFARHVVFGL